MSRIITSQKTLLVPRRKLFASALATGIVLAAPAIVRAQFFNPPMFMPNPAAAGGVAVNSVSIEYSNSPTSGLNNLTVNGGLSNSAMILTISLSGVAAISAVTAVWDQGGTNQSMTLLGSTGAGAPQCFIFGRRSPTAGTKNLNIQWTTSSQIQVNVIVLTGVNQTSDAAAFPNFNSATGASSQPAVTITSATGHIPVAVFSSTNNFASVTGTQTYIFNGGVNFACAGNYDTGAASVALKASPNGTSWAAAGVDVSS